MPKMLQNASLALALAAAAGVVPAQAQQQPAAPPGQSQATAVQPQMDTVIATVDGSEITMAELVLAIEGLPAQYRQMPLQALYEPLLRQLVERRLLAQAAERQGLAEEPEVIARLASARERVLQETYLRQQITEAVTEEALRARYDSQAGGGEEEVRARHILTESRDDAEAVIADLNKGADFATLAQERSTGPSKSKGGDLGFFKRGEMVPEFADAAFALGAGEISGPVQSQFGWHVIKVEERREAPRPSFEESLQELREAAVTEVVGKTLAGLAENVEIKTYNPDGSERTPPSVGQ